MQEDMLIIMHTVPKRKAYIASNASQMQHISQESIVYKTRQSNIKLEKLLQDNAIMTCYGRISQKLNELNYVNDT